MKALKKSVILAGVALGVANFGLAAEADVAKTYAAKCASCHGKDLKGNPAMAKAFKLEPARLSLVSKQTLNKTDEELNAITAKGEGKMPAYAGKLKAEDIAALTAYIRKVGAEKK